MNDILDLWLKEGIEERGNQSQNSFQKWIVPLVGGEDESISGELDWGPVLDQRRGNWMWWQQKGLPTSKDPHQDNMTLLTEDSNGFLLIESTSWGDLRGGST